MDSVPLYRPPRALLVDDEPQPLAELTRALGDRGIEVVTARDGASGLRALAEDLFGIDVLVADLLMPDGDAFVRAVRNAGGERDLPIVVLTGRATPDEEARLRAGGLDAVVQKAEGAVRAAEVVAGIVGLGRGAAQQAAEAEARAADAAAGDASAEAGGQVLGKIAVQRRPRKPT